MNQKKIYLILIVLAITTFVNGQILLSNKICFNGFYQTKPQINIKDNYTSYNYLRFYIDEKVISVTSTGTSNDLKSWFNLKMDNPSIGNYKVLGKRIYFTSSSKEGTVIYIGRIKKKQLILKSISLINGKIDTEKYNFIAISNLK